LRLVKSTLLGGLLWGIAALVFLATAFGGWVAWRAQAHLDAISRALAAAAGGKLDQRVARRHTGDDLDRVSEQINGALDQIQRLVLRVDQVSADIAHDLKRPIGRLRQKLDVALRQMSRRSGAR
jgi:signal transduction histidine kinase